MLNSVSQFIAHFIPKKSVDTARGMCCLAISHESILLVHGLKENNQLMIDILESFAYTADLVPLLSEIVKKFQLKGASTTLVLGDDDYQSVLTDSLPVAPTEFQAAIRWKIKDLLRFPLQDVVLDSYIVPKRTGAKQDKIMVVAANARQQKLISDQIKLSGLNINKIDIQELALMNVSLFYEKTEESILLVYAEDKTIQLLITAKKQLYISRQLMFSFGKGTTESDPQIERLAAEIERSFDYFQRQWGEKSPLKILFASTQVVSDNSLAFLSKLIGIEVIRIKIEEVIKCHTTLSFENQGKYLPIIGGLIGAEGLV